MHRIDNDGCNSSRVQEGSEFCCLWTMFRDFAKTVLLQITHLEGVPQMKAKGYDQEHHRARSNFVRELVQRSSEYDVAPATLSTGPRRTIVQYWDQLDRLPDDVRECIESWRRLESHGFELLLIDDGGAKDFIAQRLGTRYVKAYDRCYHPAMKSDYFRLCYLLLEGGGYLDADDVCLGSTIGQHFRDGRLKVQPLCYDISTDQMVPTEVFTEPGANASTWIFYFNNNPLIAAHGHPIVERALARATETLEFAEVGELPEIQSTTGPGNLTRSIFELAHEDCEVVRSIQVLSDWEDVAISKWPLSYRDDARNWRLSNRKEYRHRSCERRGGDA